MPVSRNKGRFETYFTLQYFLLAGFGVFLFSMLIVVKLVSLSHVVTYFEELMKKIINNYLPSQGKAHLLVLPNVWIHHCSSGKASVAVLHTSEFYVISRKKKVEKVIM